MNTLKIYIKSFSIILKSLKIGSIIYLIFLLIALLLTIPFYRLFVGVTESNVLSESLMNGFNATAFGDLIRADGKVFLVYIKGLWPWLLAFWMLGVYFYGMIISWVRNPIEKFNLSEGMNQANKQFWAFLKLSVYVLIIQAIVAFVIYLIPVILVGNDNLTDDYIVRTIAVGVIIHLFFFATVSFVADIARFKLFQASRKKVLKTLWQSIKFIVRRFGSFWIMYILWVILPLTTMALFIIFRKQFNVDTSSSILILFLIQQAFVWLKFLFKIQKQGLFYSFYIQIQETD